MKVFDKLFGSSKKKPMTAKDHTKLGYEYDKRGKKDEAIREYQEALRIDPNFALARSNLGFIFKEQGRLDDAIREWEETLRRGVDSVIIRGNTEDWLKGARALRDERAKPVGDIDSALGLYIKELGQASDKWSVAYDALERIGPPAVNALIRAIESDNNLLRGRAISLLGDIGDERAIEPLTKASKISEQDFRRMTGITGETQTEVTHYHTLLGPAGTKFEIALVELLKEHRENAKRALKNIKKKRKHDAA